MKIVGGGLNSLFLVVDVLITSVTKVLFLPHSVCFLVSPDYSVRCGRIFMKILEGVGPTTRNSQSDFESDCDPRYYSVF